MSDLKTFVLIIMLASSTAIIVSMNISIRMAVANICAMMQKKTCNNSGNKDISGIYEELDNIYEELDKINEEVSKLHCRLTKMEENENGNG